MNSKQLNEAITQVDDRYLAEADARRRPLRRWQRLAALAAALALVVTGSFFALRGGGKSSPTTPAFTPSGDVKQLAAAVYPETVPYPILENYTKANGQLDEKVYEAAYDKWSQLGRAQRAQYSFDYQDALRGFLTESIPQVLSGTDGENRVYAPKNVYLALAMLAETTDGETRAQLLSLLGAADMETLRRDAEALWNRNYADDGTVTSVLSSAIFLRGGFDYVQSTLDALAAHYYADAFSGEMGSPDYDKTLQDWLNAHTGGILTEQASAQHLDDETVAALATTAYFRAKWAGKFRADANTQDVFHAPSGDVTAEFMHHDEQMTTYFWGDKFAAVSQGFENFSGRMWFLLPDEGVSVDELLADEEAMAFLTLPDKGQGWENNRFLKVNFAVPKFDVASDLDLASGLAQLGVTDVFDPARADFSALTDFTPVWASEVKHAARVVIDEEGCTAAAFTIIHAPGAPAPPDEIVDFVLDRPFLFCITGSDGLPLFTGVVNRP